MLDLALFAKGRENYILKLGMVHPKLHVKKILKENYSILGFLSTFFLVALFNPVHGSMQINRVPSNTEAKVYSSVKQILRPTPKH